MLNAKVGGQRALNTESEAELTVPSAPSVLEMLTDAQDSLNRRRCVLLPDSLSIRHGKHAIQQGLAVGLRLAVGQAEFRCQPGKATSAGLQPVPDFLDHAR